MLLSLFSFKLKIGKPMFQNKKTILRISKLSILGSIVIFGVKSYAFLITGSVALRSDAIESVVNIVAALFAFGALVFALRPADENHPYGHGKMEYVSAVFEGGLISLASVFIFLEASFAIIEGPQLRNLDIGLVWAAVGGALNGVLGLVILNGGRKLHSKALEADGHHIITDFWTSVGIVMGVLLVKMTGYVYLDPIMAIVVAALLARTGFKIMRPAFDALLDAEDQDLLAKILDKINTGPVNEVITVHKLRAMRAGRFVHIDVHMIMPEYLDVKEAHKLSHVFAEALLDSTGLQGEWHTHMEPCRKNYCAVCPMKDCPIREGAFVARKKLTLDEATSPTETLP